MKNIFAINITEDKNNVTYDGERFIQRKISDMQGRSLEQAVKTYESLKETVQEPTYIRVIKGISGYMGIICVLLLFKGLNYYILSLGVIGILIWGLLALYTNKMRNRKMESDEFKAEERKIERIIENSKLELQIPEDAKEIDVLRYFYKVKNGKTKIASMGTNKYFNMPVFVYKKEDELCFSSMKRSMSIPVDCIREIKEVDKTIQMSSWNKVIPYNSGEYKKYRMTTNQFGNVFIKSYFTLIMQFEEEEYKVFIPPYDASKVLELTGLTATK